MNTGHSFPIIDRRPQFPEVVAFGAPRGFKAQLRAAAAARGESVAAFGRRVLEDALPIQSINPEGQRP